MQSIELIEYSHELWDNLQLNIDELLRQGETLEIYQAILLGIDSTIRELKSFVVDHPFENWAFQIEFFKRIKPKFISKFIYYSKICELESTLPSAGKESVRTYLEKELELLKQFYSEHQNFIAYFRKSATYLDQEYFTRRRFDLSMGNYFEIHNRDERFSTQNDHLVAEILANELWEEYLVKRLNTLDDRYDGKILSNASPLHWTSSKAALLELLYALHQSKSFNSGAIEFAKVIRTFENTLNIDLGNYHKTLGEVRDRKTERTKFLNKLSETLEKHFEEVDHK